MSTATPKKIRVAIVGGGMVGLALALGLRESGSHNTDSHLDVAVYEAAHHFAEIGAGVAIGPNAQRALALLHPDAHAAFQRLVTGNGAPDMAETFLEYRVGMGPDAGKVIAAPRNETGQSTVHRAKFLDEFVKLIPEGMAQFGKRLEKLVEREDGTVEMHFRDGTMAEAECVIGADGIHSVVRSYVLGPEHPAVKARFTGSVGYRGLVPMAKAVEAVGERTARNSYLWAGHGRALMTFPIDHGETLNVNAIDARLESWDGPWVQPADPTKVQGAFAEWSDDVKKIIELLDTPDTLAYSLWEHPPAPTFYLGRVAMVGDAAHSSTPFQGQGAGQGFEDAFVLASLLAHVDEPSKIPAAFQAYDRIRRPRSIKSCQTSREAGEVLFFRQPGVGDNIQAVKENLDWRMDWLWHHDIASEREQAMKIFNKILSGGEIYPFET